MPKAKSRVGVKYYLGNWQHHNLFRSTGCSVSSQSSKTYNHLPVESPPVLKMISPSANFTIN